MLPRLFSHRRFMGRQTRSGNFGTRSEIISGITQYNAVWVLFLNNFFIILSVAPPCIIAVPRRTVASKCITGTYPLICEFGSPFFRLIPSQLHPFPISKTTLPNSIYARIFLFFSKYLLLLQFVMGTDSELFAIRLKKLIESQPIMSNGMECECGSLLSRKRPELDIRDFFCDIA